MKPDYRRHVTNSMPVKLNYTIFGDGQPVIILHGLLGSSGNWTPIAKKLAPAYQVITVDLRNHGDSEHNETMTYEAMADDVEHLIESLCLKETVMIGHSLGGKVAMTSALRVPGLFSALIVLDIAPIRYRHQFDVPIDAMGAIDVETITSRREADQKLAPAIPDAELRRFLLQNLAHDEKGFHWRVNLASIKANREFINGFPLGLHEGKYPGPALFLAGADSEFINHDVEPDLVRYFPAATIASIENAGHWLHVDQPAVVLEKIRVFIAKTLSAPRVNS